MIANALILPTERPFRLIDVKRALLSYDSVYVPSPEDREIIPPNAFAAASSPMGFFPIGMDSGPVRPLGKVANYDEVYERVIEECKPAIQQQKLHVMSAPQYHETMTIGAIPMPDDTPNPTFVYQTYRAMATNPDFVAAVGRGLESLSPLPRGDVEQIAPSGAEDRNLQFYIDGVLQPGLPRQAQYSGFVACEEERAIMTRLCLARLGSVVKNLAVCHLRGLQPYASDAGVANVIQLLNHNTQTLISNHSEDDSELATLNRLARLHDIVLSEFMDAQALDELSVQDVLKLRTKAWGKAREARTELDRRLRLIAIDNPDSTGFEKACREALREYEKDKSDLENELAKFRVKIYCDFGLAVFGSLGLATLVQKAIALGSVESVLLLGGPVFIKYLQERIPELMDLLKQRVDLRESSGYALFRPYSFLW